MAPEVQSTHELRLRREDTSLVGPTEMTDITRKTPQLERRLQLGYS